MLGLLGSPANFLTARLRSLDPFQGDLSSTLNVIRAKQICLFKLKKKDFHHHHSHFHFWPDMRPPLSKDVLVYWLLTRIYVQTQPKIKLVARTTV